MMAGKKYDLVVFGATGFTGQYVAEELAQIVEEEKFTWAVAGRNLDKLKSILETVKKNTGKSVQGVGIIQADINDSISLNEMAKISRVVLNCVGPYRFYGEAVVKACVENGANHIDISGEPQFLEKMQLNYSATAKENQVYVVGACGVDSIPADMGTVFLEEKFGGQVNSIETYLSVKATEGLHCHFGTWQSAIYVFACASELKPLRRKLFPERLPEMTPKLRIRLPVKANPIVDAWCLPFPGVDRSVVMRSQRYFFEVEKKRPIQMTAYIQCPSLMTALITVLLAAVFGIFATFKMGRKLLEKYPKTFSNGIFDHEGPTRRQMDGTSFSLTLAGKGWEEKLSEPTDVHVDSPSKEIVVRVSGPEPAYLACRIFMVQSALVVLREAEKLPPGGGVYAPGAAFAKTTLIERLTKRGIVFEVLQKKELMA